MSGAARSFEIGLSAAIVAVQGNQPQILAVPGSAPDHRLALPYGPFDPAHHRTFEMALRAWVSQQTGLPLGYVEQLYTFGDRGRQTGTDGPHVVSVGYLALTRADADAPAQIRSAWHDWYAILPWEDWRGGKPEMLDALIVPALRRWAEASKDDRTANQPPAEARLRLAFGLDGVGWNEERVLDRYELMYEAGLAAEAVSDGRIDRPAVAQLPGVAMESDHRRILATAIGRLRAKLKYRPVIFELMPPSFTLTQLQETAEAISGRHVHKQNFRRMVETAQLVEPTGKSTSTGRGRPAALYRFRRSILIERPAPGLRVGSR
ncbi:MAG: NAD regulator [Brucellaceae bacterium]|nr:NAD regulator [Brucellaceae bacterium]